MVNVGTVTTALLGVIVLLVLIFVARRSSQAFQQAKANQLLIEKLGTRDLATLFTQFQRLRAIEFELELDRPLPPLGGFAAAPDLVHALVRHIRAAVPHTVVECGSGSSTVALARALSLNGRGHLYSLENDPDFAASTRLELRRHGLETWATVLDAPLGARETPGGMLTWYDPSGLPEGSIDLLLVDGPPVFSGELARFPAGPILFPRLAPGAMVFLDDANRPEERRVVELWKRDFPHLGFSEVGFEKGCVTLSVPAGRES
ncbi:MAG: class I SAM-dependent methyltransferase [Longimicrobiales bacterium]|nr:class I SAM-dependent methyltransferase [Longimicrobiales bacterium]